MAVGTTRVIAVGTTLVRNPATNLSARLGQRRRPPKFGSIFCFIFPGACLLGFPCMSFLEDIY